MISRVKCRRRLLNNLSIIRSIIRCKLKLCAVKSHGNLAFFIRDYEYRDNRVLSELCSSMNSSAHLLRHFDINRNVDSDEDNLFRENQRNKRRFVIEVGSLIECVPDGMAYWLLMFTTDHSVVSYTWGRTACLPFIAKRPPKTLSIPFLDPQTSFLSGRIWPL